MTHLEETSKVSNGIIQALNGLKPSSAAIAAAALMLVLLQILESEPAMTSQGGAWADIRRNLKTLLVSFSVAVKIHEGENPNASVQ